MNRKLDTAADRIVGHWVVHYTPEMRVHHYYTPLADGRGHRAAVRDYEGHLERTASHQYVVVKQSESEIVIRDVPDEYDDMSEAKKEIHAEEKVYTIADDSLSFMWNEYPENRYVYVDGEIHPPEDSIREPRPPIAVWNLGSFELTLIAERTMKEYPKGRIEWNELEEDMIASGLLPNLRGAPTASWMLARLRSLMPEIPSEAFQHNDGGGYAFDFEVRSEGRVVALIQLQGDVISPLAIGYGSKEVGSELRQAFLECVLENANSVGECCYQIIDPDWSFEPDDYKPKPTSQSFNEYGWTEERGYLGADNIREDL